MKAFYCAGTHWDREWYVPFQEFRMWLVELIDELMDLLEADPGYRCFHLDGQAVMLEDYLAIRPERRERLVEHLKNGRIVAGPWYDLPDEWLISGESFVRNLTRGMRVCRELGFEPMQFGYTPDQFGHVAALPTILAGVGLKSGICWRGTQDEHYPAHFMWVGPDGSKVLTTKLADLGGYAPFRFAVRDRISEKGLSAEVLKEHFEPYLEKERNRTDLPVVLMLDAVDHDRPDPVMPEVMEQLRSEYPDIEFVWASLEEYGRELWKHADKAPERTGELRQPALASDRLHQYLIVHTISSRYPLKYSNDLCQAMLEKWVEPCMLFQRMAGGDPVGSYLDKAWEYLLKNHPHDSICGCSVDQVHRDMMYRFDQCRLIADGLMRRAAAALGNARCLMGPDRPEDRSRAVVVHNPLPHARTGLAELEVPFDADWPRTFIDGLSATEKQNKFRLLARDGAEIPFQIAGIDHGVRWKTLDGSGRAAGGHGDVYHLAVDLDVPPCGFTGFRVEPTAEATRNFGTLRTGSLSASNGIIDFSLRPDGRGALRLAGAETALSDMFLYEDTGDQGDGWTRGAMVKDIAVASPGTHVTTAVDEDGALRTVFRVERVLDVPCCVDFQERRRSRERVGLQITDLISVEKDTPFLRVRTTVRNVARDHRLRVLFPTGIEAPSFAETPFAVVERDVETPPETARWHERVNPEKAFTTLFGVQNGARGVAILVPLGLHEYAVTETPDRALALTLFRATKQTVGTSGEPDGQLQGELTFEYFVFPFTGAFDTVAALRYVAQGQTPVQSHFAEAVPETASFLKLRDNAAVVTALKQADDGAGAIVRFWNPGEEAVSDLLTLPDRQVATAHLCDLAENPIQEAAPDGDGALAVRVPPRGLATYRFTWK